MVDIFEEKNFLVRKEPKNYLLRIQWNLKLRIYNFPFRNVERRFPDLNKLFHVDVCGHLVVELLEVLLHNFLHVRN